MAIEASMAKAFGLTGEAWQRHANPWSVYTRIPIPALLAAAVWTRAWIGWWSLVPVAAVCVWAVINPRVFPPPRSLDHWASKGVLGEVFWADRGDVPVPPRHRTAPRVLLGINALGVPVIAYGLVVLDPWAVLCGLAVHMAGKNWFIDRMAILYDDVVLAPPPGTATSDGDLPDPTRVVLQQGGAPPPRRW
ncbi:DUF6653 family protein [Geodermatophilus sp. CPCC 206100]|uniref:DUF6653 family protein n=1 Tax=Geodermatophilus sp. CPCC 206100 TaxID=3020054 RepID=UPI003B00FC67